MPLSTDSGYLPDWLKALLGQGSVAADAPTGLFSEAAASPSPAVGLLSSLPQFAGVRPDAPFTANGPSAVQGTDVPLPPRRPTSLTDFQANAGGAGDPTDINAPPSGRPNANVIGTQASGAPEVTAQQSPGFGDYLGKAANAIGSIYGAGGPGDALIALGLSNRTNGASIQALNAGILNRSKQAELALKQAEANDKIRAIAGNVSLVKKLYPNMGDEEASAFARNPEMMKQIGQVAAPMEQWSAPYKDEDGNTVIMNLRTREPKLWQSANETFHPSTPEEKAAIHINPDDPTPYQTSDRTLRVTPVGGPATAVTVNNTPQLTYAGQGQESVAKQHIALAEGVDKAQEKLMNLNAMSGALQSIREKGGTTGLGEEEKTRFQSFINTAANAVGMQPFDISDKEMINKFGRLMAANAAKDAQGSRVTNFELDNFLKANPGLSLSPQGNERLLGIMQQIEQRKIDLGLEMQDRFAAGKPPSIAENHAFVRDYINKHHIKDPITGQDITADPRLPDSGGGRASPPMAGGSGTSKPLSFTVIEGPRR
jgi:hypothetical protein